MNSGTNQTRPSLQRMKARAKAVSRESDLSIAQAFEEQARMGGFTSAHEAIRVKRLDQGSRPTTAAEGRGLPPGGGQEGGELSAFLPCYGVVIGNVYWHLEVGKTGPELWRRDLGGVSPRRVSELGIFQVLLRKESRGPGSSPVWSTSTYGTYNREDLPGFGDGDGEMLSAHFGMPVLARTSRIDQQTTSERLFLQSPAFAALRRAVRQGRVRPDFYEWERGLTPVWNLLTLLTDENFEHLGHAVADALLSAKTQESQRFTSSWTGLLSRMERAWPTL